MLTLKNEALLVYAADFVSFVIERAAIERIRRIILFGSVSRGEASEESDIDLFVDAIGSSKAIEKELRTIKEAFLNSARYQNYWLLKDVKNEIKPIVGRLEEWKDLKNSIIANGIMLYGKFEEAPNSAVHKTIVSWENIKPESKRVLLAKRLFGYKKGKKRYHGMAQEYGGERLGKGSVAVPSAHAAMFLALSKR